MTDVKVIERRFIDGDGLKIVRTGLTYCTITFPDGEVLEDVEPHKLFPFKFPEQYISLHNKESVEVALLRDLNALNPESRKEIDECLHNYYFVPIVKEFLGVEEKYGVVHFQTITDHGPAKIDITYTIYQFRRLTDTRLVICDNYSNRFEIPDITKLPRKSYNILRKYL